MQTSGISSSKTRKVAGVAAVGLAIAMTGNWIACSPGVLDCQKVSCRDAAGAGGGDETGGAGGGGGGGGGGADIEPPPAACDDLSVKTLEDFEEKFIVTKCGQAKCHGPMSVFPPKDLDKMDQIRPNLVGKVPTLLCKKDFYINKTAPEKSFVLAKVQAEGEFLPCPTDSPKADSGGTRMPNKDGMPGAMGDRLPQEQIDCFEWYVKNVVK